MSGLARKFTQDHNAISLRDLVIGIEIPGKITFKIIQEPEQLRNEMLAKKFPP